MAFYGSKELCLGSFQKNYDEEWNQERANIFSDNDEDVYAFTPALGREMRVWKWRNF